MRHQNRIKLYCVKCKWYKVVRGIPRCLIESNIGHNWMGLVYDKHPDWKNYNKACKDYEEGEKDENI